VIKLSVTPKAQADLVGIWVYTCQVWGAEQADYYLDRLDAGMRQLSDYPWLGADYAHVRPGHRRLELERHAVFYRVLEHEVLVVRVLHEDMNAPERLQD
jgi:toxin ParE1/3/4